MAVNIILQGKGGVGKTLISSLLAQYLIAKNKPVICLDTDPVNQSFKLYKGLSVEHFNILKEGNVEQSTFDDLIENIIKNKEKEFVIDNGASTFIPLTQYLIENGVIDYLKEEENIEIRFHSVIVGGESLGDTILGLNTLIENMPNTKIIVWLNEFFGKIENKGKPFNEMAIYKNNKESIDGFVVISNKGELIRTDMEKMLRSKLTFDEALSSKEFRIMSKSRLKKRQAEIFTSLDMIFGEKSNEK